MVSFGFKYGIPVDADLVADMRFLPNPYWVPELRPLTGRDAAVGDYVKGRPERAGVPRPATSRCSQTVGAGYLREGKRFMTVAIGCTGGKHRSVAMTEEIARRLRGARHRRPRRCTATWGGSERPGDACRTVAGWSRSAAGTAWPRPCPRCAASSTS